MQGVAQGDKGTRRGGDRGMHRESHRGVYMELHREFGKVISTLVPGTGPGWAVCLS